MSVITLVSGIFCKEEPVIREIQTKTGYLLVGDTGLVAKAGRFSGLAETKISRAFSAKTSVFNQFTHERERSIAYLKLALAEMLTRDNLFIHGYTGQLIPKEISQVLRVCLIADMKFRISRAFKEQNLPEAEALKLIRKEDEDYRAWVGQVTPTKDPWDPSLYDILIPMDKKSPEEASGLIEKYLSQDVVKPTPHSRQAVQDFLLAAKVGVALAKEGHNVETAAAAGVVTLTINKHVLLLSRLEEELKASAGKVAGVQSVVTKVGRDFHQTDIYRKVDFEVPSKVLLVDDEREFVQTLSERLILRDMGSAVAYDGESALALVKEDEPEVMILDLKMPGIDGIEVLRRVKETRPEIEVIILTGHGSETDRETCLRLGAFAYLQKPVDIEVLSQTLIKANEKIQQNRKAPL